MRVLIRLDSINETHAHFTVFVNGANTGSLCMSPEEMEEFVSGLEWDLEVERENFPEN